MPYASCRAAIRTFALSNKGSTSDQVDNAAEVAEKALRLDLDRAQAAAETNKHDATLATYDQSAYTASLDEDDILNF